MPAHAPTLRRWLKVEHLEDRSTPTAVVSAQFLGDDPKTFDRVQVVFDSDIDAGTFTDADVALTAPDGSAIAVDGVSQLTDTTFVVAFAPQTAAGEYAASIGPDIDDTDGNSMDQAFDATAAIAGLQVVSGEFLGSRADTFDRVRLVFDAAVDAGSFTTADAKVTGPNGANIPVTGVDQVDDTTFEVRFGERAGLGSYAAIVGTVIKDLGGNDMDQDGDGTPGELPADQYTARAALSGPRVTSAQFSSAAANSFEKVRVVFDEAINAATFTRDDVTVTGPNGKAVAVSKITWVSPTTVDATFSRQSTRGVYTVAVGPAVSDLGGNQMDQNRNNRGGELPSGRLPGDRFTSTAALHPPRTTFTAAKMPVAIPDWGGGEASVSIVVPATSALNGLTVSDLNVSLSVTHPNVGDLRVTLTSPDGRSLTLFSRRGGTGDNLTNTVFDDEATTPINTASAPFTGSFRPESTLDRFDGRAAVGTWTLTVRDSSRNNVGKITAAKLHIATNPAEAGGGGGMAGLSSPSGSASLIAPLASAPPAKLAQAPADEEVVVDQPSIAPLFGGMSASEPGSVEWLALGDSETWNGFSVE